MKADLLREKFLTFFKTKKHKIVESDSLVPQDDPTVLFTPAGMNQFKRQFLGYASDFKRAATAQRCLRTDDLDKVGRTCGHHTFFEMLGNFSFGDYFKEEAIEFAWEFLTEELKIKKEQLWISVYKDDDEAFRIWKLKVPADKIIKLGDKENFWPAEAKERGPDGPCGPCSEIFFDQGKNIGCKRENCNPVCNCGRFVEVWNLVFTQFNRKDGGILEPLPKKNIDTGMGLERLAAVMQGVYSNFETDLFKPLVKEIEEVVKGQSPAWTVPCKVLTVPEKGLIYVLADHIRAITFAIYDGVLPSNETRGYVVRKLIRKCILHLRALGIKQAFMYKLVPVLSEIMQEPYPELNPRRENIAEIILAEEKNFIATLDSSDDLLKDKFAGFKDKPDPQKAGKIAFYLYDTYGIPQELTKNWLDKQGIKFSEAAFNQELEQQKMRSKLKTMMKGKVFDIKGLDLKISATKFLGYKDYSHSAKILKIIKDNIEVNKISEGEEGKIILNQTVFYPESGGQIGDAGNIAKGKNIFIVLDTQKADKIIIHIGKVIKGSLRKADTVLAKIDEKRRLSIARNHTATHLLQAALRKVLGPHIQQQGSLVAQDRLRFDFTHFKDISNEELNRIEEIVNTNIINNYALQTKPMLLSAAKRKGALAFFGEKYEAKVRVVSIPDISLELCGGTHLNSTGQIGIFKITQEAAVAAGIRRIEAVTAKAAYKMIKEEENLMTEVSSLLNVPPQNILSEIKNKMAWLKELEKRLHLQSLDILKVSLDKIIEEAQEIGGIKVITQVLRGLDMDLLRKAVDLIKQETKNSVIALGSAQESKALLVMGVTSDLCQKGLDAAKLILDVAKVIGGSGGGRKDFAQAGGNKPENFAKAFQELRDIISNLK
jgi:alanyl-tRNA synthetase